MYDTSSCVGNYSCIKEKGITFLLILWDINMFCDHLLLKNDREIIKLSLKFNQLFIIFEIGQLSYVINMPDEKLKCSI